MGDYARSEPQTMDLRHQIAFAMWNNTNPEDIRDQIKPGNLGQIVRKFDDGSSIMMDLQLDWDLNRESYLKLADIAIEMCSGQTNGARG